MKANNIVVEKSFAFGVRIVRLFEYLRKNKVERDIALQLLRSGTSIGANIEEAVGAVSKRDFINKLSIAYKEGREARYWMRLLKETGKLEIKIANSFIVDCEELLKILNAILKTTKRGQINIS